MERNIKSYQQFINENRTKEWLDDVEDSQGYVNKIMTSDTVRIKTLEFIYKSGKTGRTYTDIVRFIIEEINGEVYHHTVHRGYYSGLLTGIPSRYRYDERPPMATGILYKYCENIKNKWVLVNDKLINHFMERDLGNFIPKEDLDIIGDLLINN